MRVLWISNHPCSPEQKDDLFNRFGDHKLVELNDKRWAGINPNASLEEVGDYLSTFIPDLGQFDHVVIMGELSACLVLVSWCVQLGISVWTPTTKRVSAEKILDGKTVKTNVFRHCQLRCLHWPDGYSADLLLKEISQ